jgi:FAD/FMN-containing dehydrogenase
LPTTKQTKQKYNYDFDRIVKFCNEKGLTLSVKAGGYGTAGWAINGAIIIDLSSIDDLHIV